MSHELADLLACVAAFGQSLQATFDPRKGRVVVPARTAVVFVVE